MSSPELFAFHTCTTTKKNPTKKKKRKQATHADSTLAEATINLHQGQVHYCYRLANAAFTEEKNQVNTIPKMRNSLHLIYFPCKNYKHLA